MYYLIIWCQDGLPPCRPVILCPDLLLHGVLHHHLHQPHHRLDLHFALPSICLQSNIHIDKANVENIDIDIDKAIPENINIAIDIDKENLENIDIDEGILQSISIEYRID